MEPIRTMLLGITMILCAIFVLGLSIVLAANNIIILMVLLGLSVFLLGAGLRFVWVGYNSDLDD